MKVIFFISIIVICLVVIVSLFLMILTDFTKQLKSARTTTVKVSCAGSAVENAPKEVQIQLDDRKFYDNNKQLVKPEEFEKFWVKGSSMLLCGIKNDDLLFTRKVSTENISFNRPHVYVLKREDYVCQKVAIENDLAEFKVCRAWAIVRIGKDDIEKTARNIIKTKFFKELQENNASFFLSEQDMLDDLVKTRLKKYKKQYPDCEEESDINNRAIISTTLKASKGNKVTFSIHPTKTIVGEVIYSYTL